MKLVKAIIFFWIALQIGSAQAGEIIWRDLAEGQSPDEVAQIIRQMEGIKKVKVKKAKKKRPASLKIKYSKKSSIAVAGKRVTINPQFESDELRFVELSVLPESWVACLSSGVRVQQELDALLSQSYTQKQKYRAELLDDLEERISQRKIRIIGKNSNDYERLPAESRFLVNLYQNDTVSVENIVNVSAQTYSAGSAGAAIANITFNLCKSEAGFYGGNVLRYSTNQYQETVRKRKEGKARDSREAFREKAMDL